MAKYCTKCGHALGDADKFCAECGTLVGGAPSGTSQQQQLVQYEYCEITFGDISGLLGQYGRFRVEATGPYGSRTVTVSETCRAEMYQVGLDQFEGPSERSADVLNALMRSLSADGWELLPDRGRSWWQHRYRRPVKVDSSRVSFAPLPPTPQSFGDYIQQLVGARIHDPSGQMALAVTESYMRSFDQDDTQRVHLMREDMVLTLKEAHRFSDIPRVLARALEVVEEQLTRDPDNESWWSEKMYLLRELGRVDEMQSAATHLLRLVEGHLTRDPNDPDSWASKGHYLDILGRKQESREAYKKAKQLRKGRKP